MSFPRYPKYKPSGVEWLGEVPDHWEVKRLRRLVSLNPSKSETALLPSNSLVSFLPMEAIGQNGSIDLGRQCVLSEVASGYSYFRDGDVVIAKITPCFENGKGALLRGMTNSCGFGTTELIVMRPDPASMDPEFLQRLVTSDSFRKLGEASMYGAGGQKRVPDDFAREFATPLPPLPEQRAIAAFLDRETAKIDALIAEQEKLIALLAEKRQAVISHAVTKGLNPNAPMKPSGVEWLGEVPAHWEVQRLGNLLVEFPCYGVLVPDYCAEGVPMLRINDMTTGAVARGDLTTISAALSDEYERTLVREGDVVLSVVGTIGESLVIDASLSGINLSRAVARLQVTKRLLPHYLRWMFRSGAFQRYVDLICVGTAQQVLNMSDLRAFRIAAPSVEEQLTITAFLDRDTAKLDGLLQEAESAITLLRERRAALISAAVTGQIDVRHLAPEPAA